VSRSSAVKEAADLLNFPIYQPEHLRHPDFRAPLSAIDADLFVVAAYGLIFGEKTLAIPRYGCLNLHASLLPRFRGASPITAAILSGDTETGVTLMRMERGLDTGPMLATRTMTIRPDDTTESLNARLAEVGGELAVEELARHIPPVDSLTPQNASLATLVRPLIKADGWLSWGESAETLERKVRAMWSWPRAWTTDGSGLLQIHVSSLVEIASDSAGEPGTVRRIDDRIVVDCGTGLLELGVVQPEGKRPMSAMSWFSGRRGDAGLRLGQSGEPPLPPPLIVPVGE